VVKAEVELPGQPNRNSERTADRDLRHEPRLKADKGLERVAPSATLSVLWSGCLAM
jgi:hypothetical protein